MCGGRRAHGQGPRGLSADTPQQKEIEITILKTLTTGASPQLRVMPAGRKPRRHSNSLAYVRAHDAAKPKGQAKARATERDAPLPPSLPAPPASLSTKPSLLPSPPGPQARHTPTSPLPRPAARLPRRGRRRGRAGGSPRPSTREGGARGHSWRRPAGQLGQRRPSRPPDGQGHRGTCGRHLGVDGEERERARRRREAQQRHLQRCRGRPWIWASGRRS